MIVNKTNRLQNKRKKSALSEWLIPIALILISLVPAMAGTFRVTELATGAEITPDNARFFAVPFPVILHIIGAVFYSILGAFQFAPSFRRRHLRWHRLIGRLLVPCGFIVALTGLWMSHFYPWPMYDGVMLYVVRLLFGFAMLGSLILAVLTIWQRQFKWHGVWMVRAYAIGLGAGTQVLTHIPWFVFPQIQGELARVICMSAGWVINLIIAEWFIRKFSLLPK